MAASAMVGVGNIDHIVNKICEEAKKIIPGKNLGAVISKESRERINRYIDEAEKAGAKVLVDGRNPKVEGKENGFYVGPTVIDFVKPDMAIAKEEVFGPVLALMVAENFEEALRLANDVRFGLSASIISKDLTRVHQFINGIEAGLITVNLPTAGVEYQLPFGGTKESSFGMREQGPQALDFYSETRTVYLKYTQ